MKQLKRKQLHRYMTTSWLGAFESMRPDATDNAVIWSRNCGAALKGPCRLHETFVNTLLLLRCLLNRATQVKQEAAKNEANDVCNNFLSFCLGSKQHYLALQTTLNDDGSDSDAELVELHVTLMQSYVELGPFLQHEAVKSYMRSKHPQQGCCHYCFAALCC